MFPTDSRSLVSQSIGSPAAAAASSYRSTGSVAPSSFSEVASARMSAIASFGSYQDTSAKPKIELEVVSAFNANDLTMILQGLQSTLNQKEIELKSMKSQQTKLVKETPKSIPNPAIDDLALQIAAKTSSNADIKLCITKLLAMRNQIDAINIAASPILKPQATTVAVPRTSMSSSSRSQHSAVAAGGLAPSSSQSKVVKRKTTSSSSSVAEPEDDQASASSSKKARVKKVVQIETRIKVAEIKTPRKKLVNPLSKADIYLIEKNNNRFFSEMKTLIELKFKLLYRDDKSPLALQIKTAKALALRYNRIDGQMPANVDQVDNLKMVSDGLIFPSSPLKNRFLELFKIVVDTLMSHTEGVELEINNMGNTERALPGINEVAKLAVKLWLLINEESMKVIFCQDGAPRSSVPNWIVTQAPFHSGYIRSDLLKYMTIIKEGDLADVCIERDLRTQAFQKHSDNIDDPKYHAYEKIAININYLKATKAELLKLVPPVRIHTISRDTLVYHKETRRIVALFKKSVFSPESLRPVQKHIHTQWTRAVSSKSQRPKQAIFGETRGNPTNILKGDQLSEISKKSPEYYQTIKSLAGEINQQFKALLPRIHQNALSATEPFRLSGRHYFEDNVFSSTGVNFHEGDMALAVHRDTNYHNFTAMTVCYMLKENGTLTHGANLTTTRFLEFTNDADQTIEFALNTGDLLLADSSYLHNTVPFKKIPEPAAAAAAASSCGMSSESELRRSSLVFYSYEKIVLPAVVPTGEMLQGLKLNALEGEGDSDMAEDGSSVVSSSNVMASSSSSSAAAAAAAAAGI